MSWPTFTNMSGAWFFLAFIPLVVLYFLKLKRPRVEIPSLALWQSVVNDQRVNSPFQKFKRNLLLLLQMLLLLLLILALMQPFISAGPATTDYLPVLVDCSASMSSVVDESGRTRLDVAIEQAQGMIDNLRGQGKIALFSFSSGGRRITEFTDNKRILTRGLEQIQPTHRASRLDEVLRMADAFSRTAPVEKVVVLTDGNLNDRVDFELPFQLDVQRVAEGGSNLGITEMSARRSGPQTWDIFVRVSGSTEEALLGDLKLFQDGRLIGKEAVSASTEDAERIVFSVDSDKESLLQAQLEVGNRDSLTIDNQVWLTLPRPRPLRCRISPELYSWQHAVSVQSDVDIDTAADPSLPEYDVIISDSEDLRGVTAPINVYNGIVPEDLSDLIGVTDVDVASSDIQIVDWTRTAHLLRHVRLRDVQIGQETAYAEGATSADLEERGYEVLIHGANGPLMLQRRRGLETDYYFLFNTDRSTLPYRIAFPILASNVIQAGMSQASLSEVSATPTGVLPPLNLDADRDYRVVGPEGASETVTSTATGQLTGVSAGTVGKYDIFDGNELVASLGTGLLSQLETSLAPVEELKFTEVEVRTDTAEMVQSDMDLWWMLALLAFGFLLLEWWYFQRMKTEVTA